MDKIERSAFLKLFNRRGYVLDFSTNDFDIFTTESIGVPLCQKYGLSKGASLSTFWFCQYHLTHFIRTRIMQRERYDHSRAFFELPEAAHRWRCRFFC